MTDHLTRRRRVYGQREHELAQRSARKLSAAVYRDRYMGRVAPDCLDCGHRLTHHGHMGANGWVDESKCWVWGCKCAGYAFEADPR